MVAQISFLPVEILQHIFILTQSRDSVFLAYYQIFENALVAAALSCTCQRWRAIALGIPDLWSFLSDEGYKSWDLYMERSHPLPLTIGLFGPSPEYLLPESTERVHHIVLRVAKEGRWIFELLNSSSFRSLRTISISGILIFPRPNTQAIIPDPNQFPALKNFRCEGSNLPPFPMIPRLETISVDDTTIPVTSMLTPSASTLTHITFGPRVRAMLAPTKVMLPVLRTLTLYNTSIVITEWLCTPALESLVLQEYTEQPLHAIVRAILEWAQEPLVNLVELVVDIKNAIAICWDQSIEEIFVAFPNVRRVRWDLPSRKSVPYFGFCLNTYKWTELEDIAVRVKGEDANETLLTTLQKPKDVVKPY